MKTSSPSTNMPMKAEVPSVRHSASPATNSTRPGAGAVRAAGGRAVTTRVRAPRHPASPAPPPLTGDQQRHGGVHRAPRDLLGAAIALPSAPREHI